MFCITVITMLFVSSDTVMVPEFIHVQGGEFLMGCRCGNGQPWEYPLHSVDLDGFEIMTEEVSQDLWTEVMGWNPSSFQGSDLPVESVSWNMCMDFIEALNELDHRYIYMLPTEAQWEYACRSGTETGFHWGNCCSDSALECFCVCACTSGGGTIPVDAGESNHYGLRHMSGNVMEWCADQWYPSYEGAPSDGTCRIVGEGAQRVARGGCWVMDPGTCRSSSRVHLNEDFAYPTVGFRLVRVPVDRQDLMAESR